MTAPQSTVAIAPCPCGQGTPGIIGTRYGYQLMCPACETRGKDVPRDHQRLRFDNRVVLDPQVAQNEAVRAWNVMAGSNTMTSEAEDICDRLEDLLSGNDTMHPVGCAEWEERARVAIDMAKAMLAKGRQGKAVAWCSPDASPETKPGEYSYRIVAVRRAHSGLIARFGAFYLNAMFLTFEDEEDRAVTGWMADRETDDGVVYDPILSKGDELLGWCEFPLYTATPPARDTVHD